MYLLQGSVDGLLCQYLPNSQQLAYKDITLTHPSNSKTYLTCEYPLAEILELNMYRRVKNTFTGRTNGSQEQVATMSSEAVQKRQNSHASQ